MKECNIEKVTEVLKQFIGVQIEINKLVDGDIEELGKGLNDLEKGLNELDHDVTNVLKDIIKRIMILEEKIKHYESQNVREDINKLNDKVIRLNKKHTTEINGVQHRLNIIEKERSKRNETNK